MPTHLYLAVESSIAVGNNISASISNPWPTVTKVAEAFA